MSRARGITPEELARLEADFETMFGAPLDAPPPRVAPKKKRAAPAAAEPETVIPPEQPLPRGKLGGFDYRVHLPAQLTRTQWREEIARALAAGGRRRVEAGETFIHDKDGTLLFEVYYNIDAKGGRDGD